MHSENWSKAGTCLLKNGLILVLWKRGTTALEIFIRWIIASNRDGFLCFVMTKTFTAIIFLVIQVDCI
jgi:hypothetical protein